MNICENCPNVLLEYNAENKTYMRDVLESIQKQAANARLKNASNTQKTRIRQDIRTAEAMCKHYDDLASDELLEATNDCNGPFVQEHTKDDGRTYRNAICGAELKAKNTGIHIHGHLVDKYESEPSVTTKSQISDLT